MKCVGFSGLFLDVNEHDMINNKDFGMEFLFEERNYLSIQLSTIFKPEYSTEKKVIIRYVLSTDRYIIWV